MNLQFHNQNKSLARATLRKDTVDKPLASGSFIMEEIWKDILGFEGLYQISSCGKVRSVGRTIIDSIGRKRFYPSKILKPINRKGYLFTSLYDSKAKIHIGRISRLVAITFIPNPENKSQVNHINGIKSDNRVENLEWATPSENMIHAIKSGLKKANEGEKCNFSKLTERQVLEIRKSAQKLHDLSMTYNISIGTVSLIKNNVTWKHL